MAGDAFVVGDGFVVDERALGEVGGGDDDAAGTLAVRRTGDVVGGSSGLKSGYGFDGDWRLREECEEGREVRLHLGDVGAGGVEGFVCGGREGFWICVLWGSGAGGGGGNALFGLR